MNSRLQLIVPHHGGVCLDRAPFFSFAVAEDAQGYLEGLDQVNGVVNLEVSCCCCVRPDFHHYLLDPSIILEVTN